MYQLRKQSMIYGVEERGRWEQVVTHGQHNFILKNPTQITEYIIAMTYVPAQQSVKAMGISKE